MSSVLRTKPCSTADPHIFAREYMNKRVSKLFQSHFIMNTAREPCNMESLRLLESVFTVLFGKDSEDKRKTGQLRAALSSAQIQPEVIRMPRWHTNVEPTAFAGSHLHRRSIRGTQLLPPTSKQSLIFPWRRWKNFICFSYRWHEAQFIDFK